MKALRASSLFLLIFLFGFCLQIESKTVFINPIPITKFENRLNSLSSTDKTTVQDDAPRFIITAGAAGLAGLKGFLLGLTKGSLAGVGFGAGTAGLGVLAFEHFNVSRLLNPSNVNWTALSSSFAMPSVNLTSLFGNWGDSSNTNAENPICIVTRNDRSWNELTPTEKEANKPEIILYRRQAKQNRLNRNKIRRTQNLLRNGNRVSSPNRLSVKEDVTQQIITGETSPFERQNFVGGVDPNTVSCIFIRRGRDNNENNYLERKADISTNYKITPKKKLQDLLQSYLIKRKLLNRRKLKRQRRL